ncbi:MAG: glycosyltransferase [Candidatus Cloacimonetes bacterium]|nr:glycosyltransferase [Candidatus Cloacimonadota bacterium]
MKSVLIIAYFFPPLSGGGVQRTLKFVKYLPIFNYKPIVLTPSPILLRYYAYDKGLLKEIPESVKIYNSFILDLNWFFKILYGLKLTKLVNFINGTLLFPDYQIQWLPFAKMKIKKIMKKEKIDIIYITSPPHSTQILVKWIKNLFQVPVVIDFRDPFTFNYKRKSSNFFNKCFTFEKKILESTDFIIANTPLNKKNYVEKFHIPENKVDLITNGFDQSDFENIKIEKVEDRKILFSHIGHFHGEYNAHPFLYALSKIKHKVRNVEFRFIGGLTYQDKKLVKKLKLENIIKIVDYCSHEKAVEYNQRSSYLLLIQPNKEFKNYIPGKTFEYINSNKKILAIIPKNGSCAEIIRNTKTGEIISPDNIDEIVDSILGYIENYKKEDFEPNWAEIKKYERKNLTKKLKNIFDEVIDHQKSRNK